MGSLDVMDAFNNCCYSDGECVGGDLFVVGGEEFYRHELVSKLTDFLKFEPICDVLSIYEQICHNHIYSFKNNDVFIII